MSNYWNNPEVWDWLANKPPNELLQEWIINDKKMVSRMEHPVLDAGCGSGRNSYPFLDRGLRVNAFDPNPSAIAHLKQQHLGDRLHTQVATIQDQPFFNQPHALLIFDGVLHQLLATELLRSALNYAYQTLIPGGLLFFSVFTRDVLPENCVETASNQFTNQAGLSMYLLPSSSWDTLISASQFKVIHRKLTQFKLSVGLRSNLSCLLLKVRV